MLAFTQKAETANTCYKRDNNYDYLKKSFARALVVSLHSVSTLRFDLSEGHIIMASIYRTRNAI
jgi:hypothetical protein